MFTTLFTAALFLAPAIRSVSAGFSITETQNVVQCQDAHFAWAMGTGPYNLVAVPSDDPCGNILADLGDHNGSSTTWKVTLPAGTKVVFSLEDSKGDDAWSDEVTVGASSDASCLSGSNSTSTSSSASSSATTSTIAATTLSISASAVATSAASDSGVGSAAGAVNAGSGPSASSAGKLALPAMSLAAIVAGAIFAVSL
ncbi:hypothetical protein PLICRDRAFT_45143 [Plicaturopsis crispa FD-325 SS-3]|uniref:Uncharacterized protein n=1 Tax=Plicaturopsis crispa FD-325 SS-3 TaxID=944288 RepID=A0A0C9SYG1_PLICR|nr:hypothetical protein PLICRDRAFT_45143 [Plicaturopsis crispa FD-325 SS-3]